MAADPNEIISREAGSANPASKKPGRLDYVDPDPLSVAAISLGAASFVLQLLQTYKAYRPSAPVEPPPRRGGTVGQAEVTRLAQLEEATEALQGKLKRLHRTIERGSPNPDDQFYNAPFRVAETVLDLDRPQFDDAARAIAEAHTSLGALSLWIHQIIRHDPELARRLGERLSVGLSETAVIINRTLAEGGPNRLILGEGRAALEQLAIAIEGELKRDN